MLTDDEAQDFCQTLARHFAASLSEWEAGFVQNVHAVLRSGGTLTDKQRAKIDQIMERCAAGYGQEGERTDE